MTLAAAAPAPNAVTVDDYIRNIRAWIASIRQRTDTRSVWLFGHSEGGLIALATAPGVVDAVAGFVTKRR
ncbi:serine aminopeptidase domain-containing protein [Sphingomonas sp.]|uniref:serine aminopeptidase domain-containing protein n=1 Tax=Sphingomonas sp. TaxID=28214 RepID=UPI0035B10CE0